MCCSPLGAQWHKGGKKSHRGRWSMTSQGRRQNSGVEEKHRNQSARGGGAGNDTWDGENVKKL